MNDNAVFSLSLTGGAEEDELALVEFMLLRPGEAAPLPFAMTASQSDAFFHGEVDAEAAEAAAAAAAARRPPPLTVKSVLLGCWGRVVDARKRRVVLKEASRAAAMLGGEACYKPWLLDCEELCQRLLDGRACAPASELSSSSSSSSSSTGSPLFAWEAGAEARTLLTQPVAERLLEGAGRVVDVHVGGVARLLLTLVAAFYGCRTQEEPLQRAAGSSEGSGSSGSSASAKQRAERERSCLTILPFHAAGPSMAAMRAARSALFAAWADTAADAGISAPEEAGEDGPLTPVVPLLFIHAANIHES